MFYLKVEEVHEVAHGRSDACSAPVATSVVMDKEDILCETGLSVGKAIYLLNETEMGCFIPYWIAIIAGVATILIVTMAILTHR